MAKVSEAFPSNFLRAADLQGRTAKVKIVNVNSEDVGDGRKLVMYFQDKEKGLVLNKTNASTIAMAFGDDTDAWQGATIELFPQAVPFQGQMVPAIRVRVPDERPSRPQTQLAPNARQRQEAPPPQQESNGPDFDDEIPF